jgi:hypothetical protein
MMGILEYYFRWGVYGVLTAVWWVCARDGGVLAFCGALLFVAMFITVMVYLQGWIPDREGNGVSRESTVTTDQR